MCDTDLVTDFCISFARVMASYSTFALSPLQTGSRHVGAGQVATIPRSEREN